MKEYRFDTRIEKISTKVARIVFKMPASLEVLKLKLQVDSTFSVYMQRINSHLVSYQVPFHLTSVNQIGLKHLSISLYHDNNILTQ